MAVGFRVVPRTRVIAGEWIERARALPVANISDVMSRMVSGGATLRPMHATGGMAGPALTVKTRPGDNLMVHKALDMAVAGDVIVVDAGGDLTNAIFGFGSQDGHLLIDDREAGEIMRTFTCIGTCDALL